MKKLLFFLMMMAAFFALQSQTVIFEDNFDTYEAGKGLAAQNPKWFIWPTMTDPMVTTEQAETNPNSVKITGVAPGGAGRQDDLLYLFDNPTTGHYTLEFDLYIPSTGSNGGYFNMQKTATPGVEWGFEVYFRPTGAGYLLAGGTQSGFAHPNNEWFNIICDINLNENLATLTINGNVVRSWPFSYTAQSETGINQLGGICIFAGAPNGLIGTFYLDNFKVTEVVAPTPGEFVIDQDEPIVIDVINIGTEVINLSNPGAAPIKYEVVAVYNIETPNPTSTGQKAVSYPSEPGTGNGIWWNDVEKIIVAASYSPQMLKDHLGKTVRKFEFNLSRSEYVTAAKLCIWDMGPMGTPSHNIPIYEQEITLSSLGDGPNIVTLAEPWLIDGRYLVIGVELDVIPSTVAETAVLVMVDDTPNNQCNPLGRLIYRHAWSTLTLDGYWDMAMYVDGTPIKPWMALDHTAATLTPGTDKDLTITFGADAITEDGIKEGQLYFYSNDFNNEETILDVTVSFTIVNVDYTIAITTNSGDSPAGATVSLSNANNDYEETSDETGITFEDIVPGIYTLTVTLDGFVTHTETVSIFVVGTHPVVLTKKVFTITVSNTSGDALVGATVNLTGPETYEGISDETGITFNNVTLGTYKLTVTLEEFVTHDETITISEYGTHAVVLFGLNINGYEYTFDLYPNPASGVIFVKTANIRTIEIYSLMGQRVYSNLFSGDLAEISTGDLSAGTYMVKVTNAEGKVATKKMIVK